MRARAHTRVYMYMCACEMQDFLYLCFVSCIIFLTLMSWHPAGVKACIKAGHPVPEEPYEVTHDVHGVFDGPKNGRLKAKEKVCYPHN